MKTKQNKISLFSIFIMGLAILSSGCKKDETETTVTPTPTPTPITQITDIDGNVYHSVTIGTQTWMVENLKTTKYRNGDPIPNVTVNEQWDTLTTGAYCNLRNLTSNIATYGRLYNWYAVNDSRNLCPSGWHVPSSEEWNVLLQFLNSNGYIGLTEVNALKSTTGWSGNGNGTDNYGFKALPGGSRSLYGYFPSTYNDDGRWWTSTEAYLSTDEANYIEMRSTSQGVEKNGFDKSMGCSVRCVKD